MDSINRGARTSLWIRRLNDGRAQIMGVLQNCPLPDGVNDAVVLSDVIMEEFRDETQNGIGRSHDSIIRDGWKSIKK